MLLIRRKEPILQQERHVAKTVFCLWAVVFEVGGHIENDFHVFERNQFQTFSAFEVICGYAFAVHLP